jgi:CTP-dependent riboflavin kinase
MQALLQKQSDTLNDLEERSKQDKVIQNAQLASIVRINSTNERSEEQLKELNKNIKSLNNKTGDGLNSNVIKLFKEVKKSSEKSLNRALNADEALNITGKVGERRQFNTLKPRVENFKEGVKDFFTMRGFLDKTGIVKRGSGGIVSDGHFCARAVARFDHRR